MLEIDTNFDPGMTVTVNTPSGSQTYDLAEVLAIDMDDLQTEFMNQAGTSAWWGAILEHAKFKQERAELQLERAEVRADRNVRAQLTADGTKITEALVKRLIPDDEAYVSAMSQLATIKREVGILSRMVTALSQRSTMLRAIGQAQSQEHYSGTEPRAYTSPGQKSRQDLKAMEQEVAERMKQSRTK